MYPGFWKCTSSRSLLKINGIPHFGRTYRDKILKFGMKFADWFLSLYRIFWFLISLGVHRVQKINLVLCNQMRLKSWHWNKNEIGKIGIRSASTVMCTKCNYVTKLYLLWYNFGLIEQIELEFWNVDIGITINV